MNKIVVLLNRILIILCCLISLSNNSSLAQNIRARAIIDTAANEAYDLLEELGQSLNNKSGKSIDPIIRAIGYSYDERRSAMFRDLGLRLWYSYPKDSRKFQWFRQSFSGIGYLNNHYWLNIDSGAIAYTENPSIFESYSAPIDWLAIHEMEGLYPKIRAEYFKYLDSTLLDVKERVFQKNSVCQYELSCFLKLSRNVVYRRKKINLVRLKELFIESGEILRLIDWKNLDGRLLTPLYTMDNEFISVYKQYGLEIDDLRVFLQSLSNTDNPAIQEWIRQRMSLLALNEEPLSLKHKALDGRTVDLKQLLGKVVLVDFWSTSCSTCIARMPAIKEMYDKYKKQGFEVVSACYNYLDETAAIKKIEQKIGSDWPIIMIGGETKKDHSHNSLGAKLFKKYGFMGVPQLLLLDKSGKLVILNDILRYGDFEPLLVSLLK